LNHLAAVLASSPNSTSTISEVEPGALGFLVVAAMGAICVYLFKNMNKQFRKLGPAPEEKGVDISMEGRARREEAVAVGTVVEPEDVTNNQ